MRCRTRNFEVADPFRAIRGDFSRRFGLPTDSQRGIRVTEQEDAVAMELDLPGVSENDAQIVVNDGVLTVSGSRNHFQPDGGRLMLESTADGEFRHSFRLHESLDTQSIDAVMDRGVLKLTIAIRPESQPQTITIRTPEPAAT